MGQNPTLSATRPLVVALALVSAGTTAQQIALMQVLGWMHWHHFAYMVVAVALLGFGIAGTVLSLARERLTRNVHALLPWLLCGAGLAVPLGIRVAQHEAFAVELALLFLEPANVWRLAALCVLLLPGFFCAGLVTGIVLTVHAREAGRFYAASLAGAGGGGLAGLALVAHTTPPRLPALAALFAIAGAAALWRRLRRSARVATLASLAGAIGLAWAPAELRLSQFKPLRRTLDLPDARVVADRPGVHGWVQVVDAPALRPAPALSLQFVGEVPPQRAVFVNGLAHGSLLDARATAAPAWLDYTTDAVAFAVGGVRRVLLLENSPEGWAALAKRHGATHVTAVEPNRSLVELLRSGDPPLAAEWQLPGVEVVVASGRAYLHRGSEVFDVIRFPTVGALGGSAGLAAASEQFLLTREAFADAWTRLAPGGMLAVTAWMDFPERNPLRLLATIAEALEATGARPRTNLIAVRGWATVTFIARRPVDVAGPAWSSADLAAVRQFCADRGFDPLLMPDLMPGERQAHHTWQNPGFFSAVDTLVDGPRAPVYQEYGFAIEPASDRRPYFSQFFRLSAWSRIQTAFGSGAVPFFELGSFVVALTFVVLASLGVFGIALPLVRLGWRGRGKLGVLLYFSGLGAGFMLIEIGLMLRTHAWLGSPVVAAALVITTLLIASGLGSLWSERVRATAIAPRWAAASIVLVVLAGALLLTLLERHAQGWPTWASYPVLVLLVGGIGAALGTAFPLGLRHLENAAPSHVPWAWAVNGCVSVATPAGAMLLAMYAGFPTLFTVAAAAYLLAVGGAMLTAASTRQSG